MRFAMRQLLTRKNNPKMPERENENAKHTPFSTPGEPGERNFSGRNATTSWDMLGLFPGVANEGLSPRSASSRSNMNERPRSSGHRDGTSIRTPESDEQRKVSERSQYIPALKSAPPRVITGAVAAKEGSTYRRCEDEPIHIPGAIQTFGALLGLKYNTEGKLEVRIASENSRSILGYGPEQLFALPSFLDALGPDIRDEMVSRVDYILSNVDAIKDETRLDFFPVVLTFPYEPEIRLWCALHLAPSPHRMVICEFEKYSDSFHLKDVGAAKILPITPVHLMDYEVSSEEFRKSTTSFSKPLPAFQIARQKQDKEISSMDIFNAMAQAQKQIADCKSVQVLSDVIVGIISELTGFHRVMFYQFDSEKNGCVKAELLNPKASTDVFRGLHFPASDIPKQARELYKINRIRILHDREAETARLVCRDSKDYEFPLDLTHTYLRSMSPVHSKYLANMGVRSTMSVSIVIDGDLWGLIACHGYGDLGTRVSLPIRELCRNIAECAAINIQRVLMIQRIAARRPPSPNSIKSSEGFIPSSSANLLKLVDADSGILIMNNRTRAFGEVDAQQEALAIVSYLQTCSFTTIKSSHNIKLDFPGLSYPPGLKSITGLLIVPLNVGEGNDIIVFFRKAQVKHVKWAGNPHDKKFKAPDSTYLEPRSSFKRWTETVSGTSREWTSDQLETAALLALIWREKGSNQLTSNNQSLLIHNSSREVDSVVSFLEMALENKLDDKTRIILGRAQNALRLLSSMMDDLLRSTDTEGISRDESFNLNLTATKTLQNLQKEALRKSLDLTASVYEHLPTMVKGSSDRFRKVIAYFTKMAFQQSISVRVEVNLLQSREDSSIIELRFEDNGPGLSEGELDDTFAEFQRAQDDDAWPLKNGEQGTNGDSNGEMGSDLIAVARYVRQLNGQVRVTSELGSGTTFSIELPFEHATVSDTSKQRKFRNLFMPSSKSSTRTPSKKAPSKPTLKDLPSAKEPVYTSRSMFHGNSNNASSQPVEMTTNAASIAIDRSTPSTLSHRSIKNDTSPQYLDVSDNQQLADLNVLVAESDPNRMRQLDEKLSGWGHTIDLAYDGQECYDRFASTPAKYDVILMSVKLPLVDGVLSTRMLRLLERESKHGQTSQSQRSNQRVPIIAVSAELDEDSRFHYIQSGFDGWVSTPIDYRRLDLILQGVKASKLRRDCLCVSGQWESGGWFLP